ncbi:hypothetical protein CXF67_16885 [Psychroflexus sp. MES1-P1E]|nr:hypothetical protein CXF67_16885 [Psychroflexus sp. MES1-P1E]
MGYNASPDTPIISGISIQMSIDMKDDKKAKTPFEKLSQGRKIYTDFQRTSRGAYYGRVSDQYGIH